MKPKSSCERYRRVARRDFLRSVALTASAIALPAILPARVPGKDADVAAPGSAGRLKNPFFAMDTGTRDERHQTPESQARMLKELGYDGIGWSPAQVPEMLQALETAGLRMFNVYVGVEIDGVNPNIPLPILTLVNQLKGRDTAIWLYVTNKKYPRPSDEEGDEEAVAMVRQVADRARENRLRVALYPHTGFWLERVQDAVRLTRKVDRNNVGVTFNLCHCLKVGDEPKIAEILEAARPYLFFATINGADHTGDWDRLIQPLDQGEFDVASVLKTLKRIGYQGPIGLQHYGVKGDVHLRLQQSIKAWRKLSAQME